MAKNADPTDPAGRSREQILKDLEAAGLLRHIDRRPTAAREDRTAFEGIVLPFRRPIATSPARKPRTRHLAVAAYIIVVAVTAWVYLAR